jgi:epoxyqueuosine reductase
VKTFDKKTMMEAITAYAKTIGFDAVGFTNVTETPAINYAAYLNWVGGNFEGEMAYMSESERVKKRKDLKLLMPEVKSAIVFIVNYYRPQKALAKGCGRIARYAFGRDYHKVIGKKLKLVEVFIKGEGTKIFAKLPAARSIQIETRRYLDTGPILERSLAERAGLGVVGKNSCLITPEFGSWVFISEILTNLDLCGENGRPDVLRQAQDDSRGAQKPEIPAPQIRPAFSACGQCTRCIRACPMGAILAPGVIDARKCIAYLTIEHKGKIAPNLANKIAKTGRVFGCDICQEVCPHNISRQHPAQMRELSDPEIAGDQLNLKKISAIKTDAEFLKLFAGSPVMRTKLKGLKRNAKFA